MHNVLFVVIWPLAMLCPFLPRSRFAVGLAAFLVCQFLLWHTTMRAMAAPDWNESVGDIFVPLVISIPSFVFLVLVGVNVVFLIVSRVLLKYFPSDEWPCTCDVETLHCGLSQSACHDNG